MTLEELYSRVDGNYAEACSRLFSADFVGKFVVKFLDDPSCQQLIDAWAAGDEKAAFEAAHAAKGVCANLSLTRLATLTSDVCEALRPGNDDLRASTDVDALMSQVREAYATTLEAIRAYAEG